MGSTQDVIESYLNNILPSSHQSGFASLTSLPRPESIIVNQKVQLEWVRTKDSDGNQRGNFTEGEPITVELGFKAHVEVTNLEFGIGVLSLRDTVELFLVPSPLSGVPLAKGRYRVRMSIDPNHLRAGVYSLILKMFAGGVRQETFGDTLRFNIIENKSWRSDGHYKIWVSGFLRFDYEWNQIERDDHRML